MILLEICDLRRKKKFEREVKKGNQVTLTGNILRIPEVFKQGIKKSHKNNKSYTVNNIN